MEAPSAGDSSRTLAAAGHRKPPPADGTAAPRPPRPLTQTRPAHEPPAGPRAGHRGLLATRRPAHTQGPRYRFR